MSDNRRDLRVLVAEEVGAGHDAHEAAVQAVSRVPEEDLRARMVPIAEGMARDVIRRISRAVEDDAFSVSGEHDNIEKAISRSDFLAARFALPDGRWVTWSDATAADHRARAEWQNGYANSCMVDAARHIEAAATIEAHGVKCLAQISEVQRVA